MRVVIDIEGTGLDPKRVEDIHCIVCKELGKPDDEMQVFSGKDMSSRFKLFAKSITEVIGHNIIQYDLPVLEKLLDVHFDPRCVTDTVVLSRLLYVGRPGGHSLEAWGDKLKHLKIGLDINDWSKLTPEILERCKNDVCLNEKVYYELKRIFDRNPGTFDKAGQLEHDIQRVCLDMHNNGFRFDKQTAEDIREELTGRLAALDTAISEAFPPYVQYTQLKTKIREDIIVFNPSSPKQIIDRLWEAGWKPVNKTKGSKKNEDPIKKDKFDKYGWSLDETNLATLPENAPEGLKVLVERRMLQARVNTLKEWLGCYDDRDGRIHGRFNPLGAATHRCTHSNPNLGNVATKKTIKYNTPHLRDTAIDLGGRMRSLWICDDNSWLVGCDMESAHLRIFAHMINDEGFIKALLSGKKEDGTDPHSVNKTILGAACVDRNRAKTFIFSFLNGAAAPKVSEIFGCTLKIAKSALHGFVGAYPGLKKLKQEVFPRDAARGYFIAIDGRKIICDSEHLMMGMYLQSTESILMKYANLMWRKKLDEAGINYKQVNWVHDEWVTEVYGSKEDAELVGKIQSECIREVGELFYLRCPMGGEYKVGKNWLDVH